MKITSNVGMILLAIYLILVSLGPLFGVVVAPLILGLIALFAGIFILIGR
jgi:hypothetical protein